MSVWRHYSSSSSWKGGRTTDADLKTGDRTEEEFSNPCGLFLCNYIHYHSVLSASPPHPNPPKPPPFPPSPPTPNPPSPTPRFTVRWELIPQSPVNSTHVFHAWKEDFPAFQREGDFLFFQAQVEQSMKEEFGGGEEKRCWGRKKKDEVKRKSSEWWKSYNIWQDRFHQFERLLEGVSVLKGSSAQHATRSGPRRKAQIGKTLGNKASVINISIVTKG